MKRLVLLAAAAALAAPAFAGPADDLLGTWECTVPGAPATRTPPIVWFGPASAPGKTSDTALELDGFAREVSGISDLAPDADGWWKVQPQDGQSFMVKALGTFGSTPAISLKRSGAAYRCLRLPRYT